MNGVPGPIPPVPQDSDSLRTVVDAQAREIASLRRSLATAESRRAEAQRAVSAKEADLVAFLTQVVRDEAGPAGNAPALLTSAEFEGLLRDRNHLVALCRSRLRRLGEKLGLAPRRSWEDDLLAAPSPDDLRRRVAERIGDMELARRELAGGEVVGLLADAPHRDVRQAPPVADSLRSFHVECRNHGVDVVVHLGGEPDRLMPALRAAGYTGEVLSLPSSPATPDPLVASDPLWQVVDGGTLSLDDALLARYPDPSIAIALRIEASEGEATPVPARVLERTEVILAALPLEHGGALTSSGTAALLRARGFVCIALFAASADPATRELLWVDGLFVRNATA